MERIRAFIDSYQSKIQGCNSVEFTINVAYSDKTMGLGSSHSRPTIELDDEDLDYFYNKYYEKYLEEYKSYLDFEAKRLNDKLKDIEQQYNQFKDGK